MNMILITHLIQKILTETAIEAQEGKNIQDPGSISK